MGDDTIKVAVRVRPPIKREIAEGAKEYWVVRQNEILLNDELEARAPESYFFDYIFDTKKTNEDVYNVVKPIVQSAIEGINGTIFAYGQTSSGKTHSIMGSDNDLGIIPRAIQDIFNHISDCPNRKFLVRASFIEIYLEKIKDLLDIDKKDLVKIREDFYGTISLNCTEVITRSSKELLDVIIQGNKHRQVGETNMNERSSRSHVIFKIIIESSSVAENSDDSDPVKVSHLYFIDLAGSERVAQTKATGTRLKEGGNINKSLSALSLVIRQLGDYQGGQTTHVSFRDSKLTRILSNALGGNSKTLIIATITPVSIEDSQSTLFFAKCAKKVKNKPTVNEVLTDAALIKQYKMKEKQLMLDLETEKLKNITLQADQENKEKKIRDLSMQLQSLRMDYVAEKPLPIILKRRHTLGIDRPTSYRDMSPRETTSSRAIPLLNIPEEELSEEILLDKISSDLVVNSGLPAKTPEEVLPEEFLLDRVTTPEPTNWPASGSSTPKEVLKIRLQSLEKSHAELKEYCLNEAALNNEELKRTIDGLMAELADAKSQLLLEQRQLDTMQSEINPFQAQEDLQVELEELKLKLQSEQQQSKQALEDMIKMKAENESYNIRNAELLISNDMIKNKSRSREQELLSLLKEYEERKKELTEKPEEVAVDVIQPCTTLLANYALYMKEMADLKSVIHKLKLEASELRTENEALRGGLVMSETTKLALPIDTKLNVTLPLAKSHDTGIRKSFSDSCIYSNDLAATTVHKSSSLPNLQNVNKNSSGELVVELKKGIFSLQTLLSIHSEVSAEPLLAATPTEVESKLHNSMLDDEKVLNIQLKEENRKLLNQIKTLQESQELQLLKKKLEEFQWKEEEYKVKLSGYEEDIKTDRLNLVEKDKIIDVLKEKNGEYETFIDEYKAKVTKQEEELKGIRLSLSEKQNISQLYNETDILYKNKLQECTLLETKLKETEANKLNAISKFERLSRELDSMKKQENYWNDKFMDVEKQKHDVEQELKLLREEILTKNLSIRNIEYENKELKEALRKNVNSLEENNTRMEDLLLEINNNKAVIKSLEEDKNRAEQIIEEYQTKNLELSKKIDSNKNKLQECMLLDAKIKEAEANQRSTISELESLLRELESMKKKENYWNDKVMDVEKQKRDVEQELSLLREEICTKNLSIRNIEYENKELKEALRKNENTLEEDNTRMKDLLLEINNNKAVINSLEEDKNRAEQIIEEYQTKNLELSKKIDSNENKLQECILLDTKIKEAEANQCSAISEKETLLRKLDSMKKEETYWNDKFMDVEKQKHDVEQELSLLRKEIVTKNLNISNIEYENKELKEALRKNENSLEEINTIMKDLLLEINNNKSVIKSLEDDKDRAEQSIEDYQTKNRELCKEIDNIGNIIIEVEQKYQEVVSDATQNINLLMCEIIQNKAEQEDIVALLEDENKALENKQIKVLEETNSKVALLETKMKALQEKHINELAEVKKLAALQVDVGEDQVSKKLDQKEEIINRLKEDIIKLEGTISDIKIAHNNELDIYKAKIKAAEEKLESELLKLKISKVPQKENIEITMLQQQLVILKGDINSLNNLLNEKNTTIKNMQDKYDELVNSFEELSQTSVSQTKIVNLKLKDADIEIQKLKDTNNDLKRAFDDLYKQKEQEILNIRESIDNDQITSENKKLILQLEDEKSRNNVANQQLLDVKAALATTTDHYEEVKTELLEYKSKSSQLNTELIDVKQRYEDVVTELDRETERIVCLSQKVKEYESNNKTSDIKDNIMLTCQKYQYQHMANINRNLLIIKEDHINALIDQADFFALMGFVKNILRVIFVETEGFNLAKDVLNYNVNKINSLQFDWNIVQNHYKSHVMEVEVSINEIQKNLRKLHYNSPEILNIKEKFDKSCTNFSTLKQKVHSIPTMERIDTSFNFENYDEFSTQFERVVDYVKKLTDKIKELYICTNSLFEEHVEIISLLVDTQRISDISDIDNELYTQTQEQMHYTYKSIYEPINILKRNEKLQTELARMQRLKKQFSKEDYTTLLAIKYERDRLKKEINTLRRELEQIKQEPTRLAKSEVDERSSKLKSFKGTVKARRDSLHDLKRGIDSSISSDDCGDCAILLSEKEDLENEIIRLKLRIADLERILKENEGSLLTLQNRLKSNTDERIYLEDKMQVYSDQVDKLLNENLNLQADSANSSINVQSAISAEQKKVDILNAKILSLQDEIKKLKLKLVDALAKLEAVGPSTECAKCYTLTANIEIMEIEKAGLINNLQIGEDKNRILQEELDELNNNYCHMNTEYAGTLDELKKIKLINTEYEEKLRLNAEKIVELERRISKLKGIISETPVLESVDVEIPENIESLKLKLTELSAQVALLNSDNDSLSSRIQQSFEEIRNLRTSEVTFKMQLQEKDSEIYGLEDKVTKLVGEINATCSEKNLLKSQVNELTATNENKFKDMEKLSLEVEASHVKILNLNKCIDDHKALNLDKSKYSSQVKTDLDNTVLEVKRLNAILEDNEMQIADLQEQLKKIADEKNKLLQEIVILKDENEHLDMEVVGAVAEIDTLRKLNNEHLENIKDYKEKITELEAQISHQALEVEGRVCQSQSYEKKDLLNIKIKEITKQNSLLKDENMKQSHRIIKSVEEIDKVKKENHAYNMTIESNNKHIKQLQLEIVKLQETIALEKACKKKEIDDLTGQIETLKCDNHTLNLEVECSLEEYKCFTKRLEEHQEKYQVCTKKISDLEDQLRNAQKKNECFTTNINAKDKKIAHLEKLKKEFTADLDKITGHVEILKKTISEQKVIIKTKDDELSHLKISNVELAEAVNSLPDKSCISCRHLEEKWNISKKEILVLEKKIEESMKTESSIMGEMAANHFQHERNNAVTYIDTLSLLIDKMKAKGHDKCSICMKLHSIIKHFSANMVSLKSSCTHWNTKLTLDICDLTETENHCSDLLKISGRLPEPIDDETLQILVDLNSRIIKRIQRTEQLKSYVSTRQKYLVDVAQIFKGMEDDVHKLRHSVLDQVNTRLGESNVCPWKSLNKAMTYLILKVCEYLSLVIDMYKPNVDTMQPLECYQILLRMHGTNISELEEEIMKIVDPAQLNIFVKYKEILSKYNFVRAICDKRSDKIKQLELKLNKSCDHSTSKSASTATTSRTQVAHAVQETGSVDT